jgi:type I restriction enzyme S subunit
MSTFQEVRPGDLVMCLFDVPETPRTIGRSDHHGMITGAYTVFEASDQTAAMWLEAFYIAMDDRKLLSPLYSGLRNTISRPQFLGTKTPFPTPDEQQKIVRFIGHLNRSVNRFTRNRRRLIGVLNEQKQVIINRAVTRGLDPDVSLKPSGIDWLGDIPKHWEVFPIKRLFSHMDYGISDSSKDEGRYRVLTMGNIRNGTVTVENCGRVDHVDPLLVLDRHDLLFNRTNSLELVGKVGIFEGNGQDEVTFASYLVRMRVNEKALPQYVNYLLNSPGVLRVARLNAIPSLHQANLNPTRYGRLSVPLPPKAEQATILEYIADRCGVLDNAMLRAQREIDLIREYRTRLISDVVTGKVDVRHLAAAPGSEDLEESAEAIEPLEEVAGEPDEETFAGKVDL